MPDNQNPGQTTVNQVNVLSQSFDTLQRVVNYGQAAVDSKTEPNDRFALQSDLNNLSGEAAKLQTDLNTLKGSGTGSVQSQIDTALGDYAEITPKGNVCNISIDSGESKASFISPKVYVQSGNSFPALAYGQNVVVNGDGTFDSGNISVVRPTNGNQMLVSTDGGNGLEFKTIPTVKTDISEETGKALVDINVATVGDSTTISGTRGYFVNGVTISGTGNVVDSASVSNNVLKLAKNTTAISSVAGSQTGETSDIKAGDVAIKSISKSGSALSYATTKVVTPSQLTSQLNGYWQKFNVGDASGLKDYIDKADKGLSDRIGSLESAIGSDDAGDSLTSRVKTIEDNYSTLTDGDPAAKLSDYMKKDDITFSVSGGTLTITVKE